MKTLVLLSIILAVALGRPPIPPGVEQNPVLTEDKRSPLVGDWVPAQGHVVVEDPAPQARPGFMPVVKPEPDVKEELEVKVEKEVKENTEVKVEPEVQPKPEIKVEPEVQPKPEIKVEPEVKVESEDQPKPEIKVKPEVQPKPEIKVEPEVQPKPDVKVEPEVNPDVLAELKVEVKPEVKDDPEFKVESEVKVVPEVLDMEGKEEMVGEPAEELEPLDDENMPVEELSEVEKSMRAAFQNQIPASQPLPEEEMIITRERDYVFDGKPAMEPENPQDEVEQELNDDPELMAEMKVDVKPMFRDDPEFKVESDVQEETEPEMFNAEGQEIEERHIDMERNNEMVGEPIMELEPLDGDNVSAEKLSKEELTEGQRKYEVVGEPIMELEPLDGDDTELSEVEKSLKAAFQNQDPVYQEEEELMKERDDILAGEPIMELEPLTDDNVSAEKQSSEERKYEIVGEPIVELEPLDADNMFGEEMSNTENQDPAYQPLPEEEEEEGLMRGRVLNDDPNMELKSGEEEQAMPDVAFMDEGPALDTMGQPIRPLDEYFPDGEARMGMESVGEEQLSPVALFEGSAAEDRPVLYGGVGVERSSQNKYKQGWSDCPGVILEGKCYQFFRGPQSAADAEFFCQHQFTGGHLASITSQHIHRQVMNMMLRQNGVYAHTWIGALRYLETGSFIWLDGSPWGYADWLPGEPNNAADVEKCVELLPNANGKFNDSSCQEPQAFICSYPH